MCIGETLWVPLCTYEHPNGVLIPDPIGGRLRYVFLFVAARSAFGFPAPDTLRVHTPSGVIKKPL